MGNNKLARRKIIIVLLLSMVAVIIYLISIKLAYPVFQNTRLIDPLAEIHSLFPLYYIAIALVALAGFACFAYRIENRGVHILLLLVMAIMLLYTPYYMAGFSRLPDAAKNVGVALYTPDILRGNMAALSGYCVSYPTSYIYSWIFMNTTGMEPLSYMRFFPLLCICVFVLLGYTFISKLFNSRAAFLAMLIAIPGLHYITSHASAHSIGVLLLLTTLVLLFHKGIAFRILTFVAIIAVFICHPISPLLLSIFIAAALITSYAGRIGKTQVVLAAMLAVCLAGWIFMVENAMELNIQESVLPGWFTTTRQYLLGTPFIFGGIHRLNLGIYIIYALAAVAGIIYLFRTTCSSQNSIKRCLLKFGNLSRNQLFMALSVAIILVLTVLLAEWSHVLIERGLSFMILGLSCLIASVSIGLYHPGEIKKFIKPVVSVLILFLTLSFPVVAYSIEAYTNYPASEQAGLEFLAHDVLIEKKTVATTATDHLLLYTTNFISVSPPEGDISEGAEIVAFRSTGYYHVAMRHDLSFKDNGFTRLHAAVNSYDSYDGIYTSPTVEIFSRND